MSNNKYHYGYTIVACCFLIMFIIVGLITNYGWRATYLIFGVLILLLVTPVLGVFLRDYPKDKGLEPYGASDAKDTQAVSVFML